MDKEDGDDHLKDESDEDGAGSYDSNEKDDGMGIGMFRCE